MQSTWLFNKGIYLRVLLSGQGLKCYSNFEDLGVLWEIKVSPGICQHVQLILP